MVAGLLSVDIGDALVVNSAKVQEYPSCALFFRQGHAALIPKTLHEILVIDTGKAAFGAEGDGDGAGKAGVGAVKVSGFAAAAVVDLKGPLAIQVQPAVTPELRLGMFGTGDHKNRSFV